MTADTVEPNKDTAFNFAEVSVCISRRARDILRTLKTRAKCETYSELIDILFAMYQEYMKKEIPIDEKYPAEPDDEQTILNDNDESKEAIVDPTV